ncbi:MAG: electron transport complex subunit RsxC [Planctomycetota bacterium]|jgi:electron transport complex protein RnfC
MTTTSTPAARAATFARGVHPQERKHLAEQSAIEVLPPPAEVRVPLLQHLGAPCEPTLKPRTEVALGDVVGEAKAFVAAAVHASVSGTTARGTVATLPNARHVPAVPIKTAEDQPLAGEALFEEILGGHWPTTGLEQYEPQQIADAARRAGLVGLGGAAFPTHVKLTRNEERPIRWLLVNGCECEPYLTADYRLMLEAPAAVISGALLAQRATGASEVTVAVEDNKPQAVEALRTAADATAVGVRVLRTKYPQGSEKQLVAAVLRKEVPTGGLPLDVGTVVINVGTAAALARAVVRGRPLTHRVVTVSGAGIGQPKNLLVPIGTSYRELIDYCGGLREEAARVVAGGPMMGFTLGSLDVPVTKGTSGVTVLTHDEIRRAEETACVRCGRCVDVCPMRLVPTKLALAARAGDPELARRYHIAACMECGCCAYTCPACLPLVQLIRLGKVITL